MAFTTTLVVPITPQSNEETEHVVQTITSVLNKATDPYYPIGLLHLPMVTPQQNYLWQGSSTQPYLHY